jgi:hypothetical protein
MAGRSGANFVSFTRVPSYNDGQELQTVEHLRSLAREPSRRRATRRFSQWLLRIELALASASPTRCDRDDWHGRCFCYLPSAASNPQVSRGSVPGRSGDPSPKALATPIAGRHRRTTEAAMTLPPGSRPRERDPPSPEPFRQHVRTPVYGTHSPHRRLPPRRRLSFSKFSVFSFQLVGHRRGASGWTARGRSSSSRVLSVL